MGNDDQAAGLGGFGVQCGVEGADQVLGRRQSGGHLVARGRGTGAGVDRGAQHVGHAREAVADFVRQCGEQIRLGPRQGLGPAERSGALLDQDLAFAGQGELAAQQSIEDQRQGQDQGQCAHGDPPHGQGVPLDHQRQDRRDAGGRTDDQQAREIGRGEEYAGRTGAHPDQFHSFARGAGIETQYRHLGHRRRPHQPGQDLDAGSQSHLGAVVRPAFEGVDQGVEDRPVDGEDEQARRHP